MPNLPELPDISGKTLVAGIGKGARKIVVTAGSGALAVGGFVVRRVLGGHGDSSGAEEAGRRGPAGHTVTAPPPAVERPADRPTPQAEKAEPTPIAKTNGSRDDVPRKPKAAKPKAVKPKTARPKADAPKAKPAKAKAKPKAAKAKAEVRPPLQTGTDAPPKPSVEPGNISLDREHPHRALSNPVVDPDETEYPDPFETREDPRDPIDLDDAPFGEEAHPPTGAVSTSEPRPASDPEVGDRAEPPKRENLDD
jgi:hypothetical protein